MSSGSKKWVTEQTSLTGGTVDIYVEDKTTLRGAVIASTTGDLTLDTGSLEYSNIKDKDRSSNVGGGVNVGSDSKSVNATYGFTDKRQTNFATVGEGEITVRDGSSIGNPEEYSGLKRDVSKSQYNTKDGGLQGGFTVDTATVNLIAHPENTVSKTVEAIDKGIDDGKARVVDTSERTVNCYKSVNAGDGLTWENQDERVDRLAEKLLFKNDIPYAEGVGAGESSDNMSGDSDNTEKSKDKLADITDPSKMGQNSPELKNTLTKVFTEIREDDSNMMNTISELEETKLGLEKKAEKFWSQLDPNGERFGDHEVDLSSLSDKEKVLYKQVEKYANASIIANNSLDRLNAIHDYVMTENMTSLVNTTARSLCNVEAYWEYGTAVGKEDRTFKDFYQDELNIGRIGSVNKNGNANAYFGAGGGYWAKQYGLDLDGKLDKNVGTNSNPIYKPIDKSEISERLSENSNGIAMIWKKNKNSTGGPNHYSIIKKGDDGIWRDYDHNRQGKIEEVDFSRVYRITQEKN